MIEPTISPFYYSYTPFTSLTFHKTNRGERQCIVYLRMRFLILLYAVFLKHCATLYCWLVLTLTGRKSKYMYNKIKPYVCLKWKVSLFNPIWPKDFSLIFLDVICQNISCYWLLHTPSLKLLLVTHVSFVYTKRSVKG